MDEPARSMRNLARRLFAAEAAGGQDAAVPTHEAVRVFAKLRFSVTRFAGLQGFLSLLRRALALARIEVPSLHAVTLKPDGSLEGIESLEAQATDGKAEAAVAIAAHLLWLLVTFIGEPLTLRLVRDAWPNESFEELN